MAGCQWSNNTAEYGGAIYATQGCDLTVFNTTFESNYAQVTFHDLTNVCR